MVAHLRLHNSYPGLILPGLAGPFGVFFMTQYMRAIPRELDEAAMRHGFTKQWEGETLPNTSFASDQIAQTVGKAIALFAVGVALLFCIVVIGDPLVAATILLLTLYFFAPTVHPWYIAWLVPFAALRWSPSSLVFSAAGVLGYASWWSVAHGGPWSAPWWLVTLEYGVVFAVMVWEVGRRQPASATS